MTPNEKPRPLGAAEVVELSFRTRIDNPTHKSRPPISQAAIPPAVAPLVRLQYLARRLHGLGEKPVYHFLNEIERGEPLRPHLERYAALPVDFIKANGGDRFAPSIHMLDGGGNDRF